MRRSTLRFEAFVLAFAAFVAAPACAQEGSHKVITTSLTSTGAHKECISLAESQSLRYWFRADGLLNFSIQVQSGKEVSYPVRHDKVSIGSGSFIPKAADVHCMVLTNIAGRPVTVRLEFARLNR